jgi:polyphosphate kinase 2 (PPK2 family)
MIERTSTGRSPWVLVEADDKYWARVKVVERVRDALAAAQ